MDKKTKDNLTELAEAMTDRVSQTLSDNQAAGDGQVVDSGGDVVDLGYKPGKRNRKTS